MKINTKIFTFIFILLILAVVVIGTIQNSKDENTSMSDMMDKKSASQEMEKAQGRGY